MKTLLIVRVGLVLGLSLIFVSGSSADLLDRIHRQEKVVSELESEVQALERDNSKISADKSGDKADLSEKIAQKYRDLEEAKTLLQSYLDQRDRRVKRLDKKIDRDEKTVKKLEGEKQKKIDEIRNLVEGNNDQSGKDKKPLSDDEKKEKIEALQTELRDIQTDIDGLNDRADRKFKRVQKNIDPTPIPTSIPSASPSTEVKCGDVLPDGKISLVGCVNFKKDEDEFIPPPVDPVVEDLPAILEKKREFEECWRDAKATEMPTVKLMAPPFPAGKDELNDEQKLAFTTQIQKASDDFISKYLDKGLEVRIGRIETKAGASQIPGKDNEGLARSRGNKVSSYVFDALGFETLQVRRKGQDATKNIMGATRFSPGVKRDVSSEVAGPKWSDKAMKDYFKEKDPYGVATDEEIAQRAKELAEMGRPYTEKDLKNCCSKPRYRLLYYPFQYNEVTLYPTIFDPNREECKAKVRESKTAVSDRVEKGPTETGGGVPKINDGNHPCTDEEKVTGLCDPSQNAN